MSEENRKLDLLLRTLRTFNSGVWEENAPAECKYCNLNREGVRLLLEYIDSFIKKLTRIENYLDRRSDIPMEVLVNVKNIIHSEVEDEVI